MAEDGLDEALGAALVVAASAAQQGMVLALVAQQEMVLALVAQRGMVPASVARQEVAQE